MQKVFRLSAALLLIFVLIFNTVSCDVISGLLGGGAQNGGAVTPDGDGQADDRFYIDGDGTIEAQVGDVIELSLVRGADLEGDVVWTGNNSCASVENGVVTALSEGVAIIKATLGTRSDSVIIQIFDDGDPDQGGTDAPDQGGADDPEPDDGVGETVIVPGTEDPVTSDPYINVDKDEFYESYTPAVSYNDAYYRTQHGLMSGSIDEQDQEPTISRYRPKADGKYIRNDVYLFSEDGNTYYVVDCYGEIAFEIYRGGAYVVLEEVAAYVFAFGEIPANHSSSKKGNPSQSIWGEYLRLNHSKFSGDTSRYPYEPVLPRISGCGGDLTYYEMDIGTTGTDCDPSYSVVKYNNGSKITRGAARIVYSYKDKNGDKIIDLDERYVFYTYNHYNDFQEYLNYEGGWGEIFGNVTGGGTLDNKTDKYTTPYVETARRGIKSTSSITVVYYYVPKFSLVA